MAYEEGIAETAIQDECLVDAWPTVADGKPYDGK